ncbi:hypothetical protein EV121DRAFT_297896 [Schizophyllum commune]
MTLPFALHLTAGLNPCLSRPYPSFRLPPRLADAAAALGSIYDALNSAELQPSLSPPPPSRLLYRQPRHASSTATRLPRALRVISAVRPASHVPRLSLGLAVHASTYLSSWIHDEHDPQVPVAGDPVLVAMATMTWRSLLRQRR